MDLAYQPIIRIFDNFETLSLISQSIINQLENFKSFLDTIMYVLIICSQPVMMTLSNLDVTGLSILAHNQNISEF